MPRSGTSLTANVLRVLGVDLGPPEHMLEPTLASNPKGYWEQREINALNDAILESFGGSFQHPPDLPPGWERDPVLDPLRPRASELIQDYFGDSRLWGWKDPRNSLTQPFWQEFVPDMAFVLCVRAPEDVATSWITHDPVHGLDWDELLGVWLQYNAAALRNTSGAPRLVVCYDRLLAQPQVEVGRLAGFLSWIDIAPDGGQLEEALQLVDDDLGHHRTSVLESIEDPRVPTETRALYALLEGLAGADADTAAERLPVVETLAAALWDRYRGRGEEQQMPVEPAAEQRRAPRRFPLRAAAMRALGPVRAAASAVVPSHAPEAVPSGAVDNPEPNTSRYRNDVWVCGHVLFPGAATARVEVTVDGGPPMRAPLHRVAAVCDFELLIPPSALPDGAGEVTLSVTAMSTAGESIELGTPTLRLLPPQRGTEQDDVLATELRERVVTAGAGRQSGDRLIAFAQGVVHNGAPEQLLGLATRLSAGGAPVTTVAEMERSLQDRFEAAGTPVQMSTPVSLTSPAHYESRLAELASWVARQAPRGIVVQGIDSFPAVDLASRLEIPCVWLLHETVDPTVWWITHALAGPEFEYARDRASTALHGATATVFPSAAIRALYAPFIEPGRAHVVPNGVDTAAIMRFRAGFEVKAARAALGITADTTVIFSPGRISPRSNKIELLQGLAEVGDRRGNVCLVLPSPGDLASEETTVLRDYAARAGLGDVIRILPAAGGYHWYAMADLVVVDAEAGDVPLFPLEAMAFENVVLASRVGGIDETIEHGTHGWLWDQNDLDGLIAAFASALSMSPNERREMGAEAAARIAERHRASDSDAALLRLLSRAPMLPDP